MKKNEITFFDRLFLKYCPDFAMRRYAKKMGIKDIVFDKAHQMFLGAKRIDFFPSVTGRGLIIVIDLKTTLFFYQEGDHFTYDGYEMGKYNKGDVAVFDGIKKVPPLYP
jgi:hypothetical protein